MSQTQWIFQIIGMVFSVSTFFIAVWLSITVPVAIQVRCRHDNKEEQFEEQDWHWVMKKSMYTEKTSHGIYRIYVNRIHKNRKFRRLVLKTLDRIEYDRSEEKLCVQYRLISPSSVEWEPFKEKKGHTTRDLFHPFFRIFSLIQKHRKK